MLEPRIALAKGRRDKYSRVICMGCRDRRIRCELPNDVEIPDPGELRTIKTPCYRCRRLGIPCVIRQTILGRPNPQKIFRQATDRNDVSPEDSHAKAATVQPKIEKDDNQPADSSNIPHSEQPYSGSTPSSRAGTRHYDKGTLVLHTPRSTETVLVARALDTLRQERCEDQWFRHLAGHIGHMPALDLSIQALVAACAYSRGVPRLTSGECYEALSRALKALQATIELSPGEPDDDILATTALLAPFEGTVVRNGIPTRSHVEGLATILTARSATYPVTPLAKEILDFYVSESTVMACIKGTPSPFETVARAYFANDRTGCNGSDRAQLQALGTELFIRLPRLVGMLRSLRLQSPAHFELLGDAVQLAKSLLLLQDTQAEAELLRNVEVRASTDPDAPTPLHQSLHFASVQDFEALARYWQSRLLLLRLEWYLNDLALSEHGDQKSPTSSESFFKPTFGPRNNEMFRLVKSILMCSEYSSTLQLRKHAHLFAHAMVVVWGVMMDQEIEMTPLLSDVLLRRVSKAVGIHVSLTAEDMDTAADIFAGGLPRGRFADMYGF